MCDRGVMCQPRPTTSPRLLITIKKKGIVRTCVSLFGPCIPSPAAADEQGRVSCRSCQNARALNVAFMDASACMRGKEVHEEALEATP